MALANMDLKTKIGLIFGRRTNCRGREEKGRRRGRGRRRRRRRGRSQERYGNYLEYGFYMDHMGF